MVLDSENNICIQCCPCCTWLSKSYFFAAKATPLTGVHLFPARFGGLLWVNKRKACYIISSTMFLDKNNKLYKTDWKQVVGFAHHIKKTSLFRGWPSFVWYSTSYIAYLHCPRVSASFMSARKSLYSAAYQKHQSF